MMFMPKAKQLAPYNSEKHYKNIIDGVINKIACIMDESVVNNHLSESEKISRNPVGGLHE